MPIIFHKKSIYHRIIVILCILSISNTNYYTFAHAKESVPLFGSKSVFESVLTKRFKVSALKDRIIAFGASFSASETRVASIDPNFEFSVSCHGEKFRTDPRLANVTAGCRAISVLSPVAITLALPYDPIAVPEGQSEQGIRIFDLSRVASGGLIAPLETYVDIENKKTLTTLKEQASHFINGVLKAGERPEKAPLSFSSETLKPVLEANPVAGVPIVKSPEANTDGDLRLSYPIEFPGARPHLRPSVSIGYSAQSRAGNIAEGWRLDVPTISVETRWGVPIYDNDVETETYVFNGDQLLPQAGDYLPEAPDSELFKPSKPGTVSHDESAGLSTAASVHSDRYHLVQPPHRASKLRDRERGTAHFILRKGDGSWRFVRHGDRPDDYWWEAWQENPSGQVKIQYFGRAPGRLQHDVEPLPVEGQHKAEPFLRRDGGSDREPITRWALTREQDAHGNIVDYEYVATCDGCVGKKLAKDRDLYLSRVIYTHHADIEETVLRCREQKDLPGCNRKQGLYEAHFNWIGGETYQLRSEARTGGLVVSGKLLETVAFRFRKRTSLLGETKLGWECSAPFLGYAFDRTADTLYAGASGARSRLKKIRKIVPNDELTAVVASSSNIAFFPSGTSDCARAIAPPGSGNSLATRFGYITVDASDAFGGNSEARKLEADFDQPSQNAELSVARTLVKALVGGGSDGPFAASLLGSSNTSDSGFGIFLGLGFPTKAISFGANLQWSNRTSQTEQTSILDVDGDGVQDLLVFNGGRWSVRKGKLDNQLNLTFAPEAELANQLPFGFRFQHEPVSSTDNSGFEANFAPAMLGNTSGSGKTVQHNYLADMDGDGRIDVVTPRGVFYNVSNRASFGNTLAMESSSRFIGGQARDARVPGDTPNQGFKVDIPKVKDASERNLRHDAVRIWRAPFKGVVAVRGKAEYVGSSDSLKQVAGASPHPDDRVEPEYRARDGLMVSVEREQSGNVRYCAQGLLGPGVLSRPQTPVPLPDNTWTLDGSVSVSDNEGALLFLRLSGKKREKPVQVRINLDGVAGLEGALTEQMLHEAINRAVDLWKAPAGFDGTRPKSSNGVLTYAGKHEMWPLVIQLPPLKGKSGEDAKFRVFLSAVEATNDHEASALNSETRLTEVTTRVLPTSFDPRGEDCVIESDRPAVANAVGASLPMSVEAGDIVSFRVHSLDDGNGDVVRWDPTIAYLSAVSATEQTPAGDPQPIIVAPNPASHALSTRCLAGEAQQGLCDSVGRSLVRYRPAPAHGPTLGGEDLGGKTNDPGDWPVLVHTTGEFIAPFGGRFSISGAFDKPRTPNQLRLQYAVVKSGDRCAASSGRTTLKLTNESAASKGAPIPETDLEGGTYSIAPTEESSNIKIAENDRLCLRFISVENKDSAQAAHYDPLDVAGIRITKDRPFALKFDRVVRREGKEPLPEEKNITKDAEAPGECGEMPVPMPLDPRVAVCRKADETHYVLPYIEGGGSKYFALGTASGKVVRTDAMRPTTVPVVPWKSEPTSDAKLCAIGEVERRVALDVTTLKPLSAKEIVAKQGDKGWDFARMKLVLRRVDAANSGVPFAPLAFRLFAIANGAQKAGSIPVKKQHLAYIDPANDTSISGDSVVHDYRSSVTAAFVRFSRTTAEPAATPEDISQMAGVVPLINFGATADSAYETPIQNVGLSFCAVAGEAIDVAAALDAPLEAAPDKTFVPQGRPLIAESCVFPSPNKPDLTPALPICPLSQVSVHHAGEDPSTAHAFLYVQRPLVISMDPLSPGFGLDGSRTLYPLTHRGTNVLFPAFRANQNGASKGDESALCDPLERDSHGVIKSCDTLYSSAEPQNKLSAIPNLRPLSQLKATPEIQNAEEFAKLKKEDIIANCVSKEGESPEKQCDVKSALGRPISIDAYVASAQYRSGSASGDYQACAGVAGAPMNSADGRAPDVCGMGPDRAMFVFGDVIASSRAGMKNIHEGERRALAQLRDAIAQTAEGKSAQGAGATNKQGGKGLTGLPKISEMTHNGWSASALIGGSTSKNVNNALVDMIDMNGDGFPDLVAGGDITYTDPFGGARCAQDGVWSQRKGCADSDRQIGGSKSVRIANSGSTGISVNIAGIVNSYATAKASAQGFLASPTTGVASAQSPSTVMTVLGLGSFDFGNSKGARDFDIVDVNGDGLPDLVKNGGETIHLNLGYGFTDALNGNAFPLAALFKDRGKNRGLAVSPSYSSNNGEFSAGMTTATSASDQTQTVADINGDGLLDVVMFEPDGKIKIRLGTGRELTPLIDLSNAGVQAAGRTETDRAALAGSFTIAIPTFIPGIRILINPNFSQSGSLSRQTIAFRDLDGDGLPDVVQGEGLFKPVSQDEIGVNRLSFSNTRATVRINRLGQHGLLTSVWQATNSSGTAGPANLEFDYTRTAKTARDPHHRYVLFRTIVRDGVNEDDYVAGEGARGTVKNNARATCYFYTNGFYDRFERKFLGYGRVDTIDACNHEVEAPQSIDAGDAIFARFEGVRRTERHFANASQYEAGLLLTERVYDLVYQQQFAARTSMHTYVLLDTGRATHAQRLCQHMRSQRPEIERKREEQLLALGFVRDVFFAEHPTSEKPGEPGCGSELLEGGAGDHADPSFDTEPRRLAPIKVQVSHETRETSFDAAPMLSVVQYEHDYLGRPIRICDLGAVTARSPQAGTNGPTHLTRGAICSGVTYDETVRPSFANGATGGGTIRVEQQNRVKSLVVASPRLPADMTASADRDNDPADAANRMKELLAGRTADGEILRRRTAVHDRQTGEMTALCTFENPGRADQDPCAGYRHFPSIDSPYFNFEALELLAKQGVALRSYRYDNFGNISAYIGPVGSRGGFIRKDYHYDSYLSLIETSERSHVCEKASNPVEMVGACLNQASKLGALVSIATGIDYRFGIPTTSIDVNRNMSHTTFDTLGRPVALYLSGVGIGAACDQANGCLLPATKERLANDDNDDDAWAPIQTKNGGPRDLRLIAKLSYQLTKPMPRVVTKRFSLPEIKGKPRELTSVIFVDHLGEKVQTIATNTVCRFGAETCPADFNAVASALVKKDALGRSVATGYAKGVNETDFLKADIADIGGPTNLIEYDGLDRVRKVHLPDRNSYVFRYAIEHSDENESAIRAPASGASSAARNASAISPTAPLPSLRHVTYSRNSVCVPSAIKRDIRGDIRAVVEAFAPSGAGTPAGAMAVSSSGLTDATEQLARNPLIDRTTTAGAAQDVVACAPEKMNFDGFETSVAAYDRDSLGQLVSVRLPRRAGETNATVRSAIRVGYDGVGRRVAVDDPDRGFERILHDTAGNAVCRYASKSRGGLKPADVGMSADERTKIMDGTCARPSGWGTSSGDIQKIVTTDFAANLPVKISHEENGQFSGERREISYEYGQNTGLKFNCAANDNEPVCRNQVGRVKKIDDNVGVQTRDYDVIGRIIGATRSYAKLGGSLEHVTVKTSELFDIWGLAQSKTVEVKVPPLSGSALPVEVHQTTLYKYTLGGQLTSVVGISRTGQGPSAKTEIQPVVDDMRYDERGNLVVSRYANGVETQNDYRPDSNRLATSVSTIYGSGLTAADLLFQSISYRYDAAGNVLSYANRPEMRSAYGPDGTGGYGGAITSAQARATGLLITSSSNAFAYDQLNRLSRAEKTVTTIYRSNASGDVAKDGNLFAEKDPNGDPQLFNDAMLGNARKLTLKVEENFDFQKTHEMASHGQRISQTVAGKAFSPVAAAGLEKKAAEERVARYETGNSHRHAPKAVTTSVSNQNVEKTTLTHDTFGRLRWQHCRKGSKPCLPDAIYGWNADDTLRRQVQQVSTSGLPDDLLLKLQQGVSATDRNKSAAYHEVDSAFDDSGARVHRKTDVAYYTSGKGERNRETLSDTLYIDTGLTITRRSDQAPQAMVHYFAGGARVASQWLGERHLFGYHSQLLTRNVSDVVVAEFASPAGGTGERRLVAGSTRLHSQQEYTAFGRVVHEREMALDPAAPKPIASRKNPGLPAYRFNAKEVDDSGLQDFGARFYDNRFALWLRPDPVLHDYLDGKHSGGVYAPKNLASYGFGWGNPVGYGDADGNLVFLAALAPIVINAGRAAIVDAVQTYAMQAIEIQLGLRDNFDHMDVLQGAAFAAASGGFSSVKKAGALAQLAQKASEFEKIGTKKKPLHVLYSMVIDGTVYVGRTKGVGTAEEIAESRVKKHMRKLGLKTVDAEVHAATTDGNAMRGIEDLGIQAAGGSKSSGGSAANKIRGVSPSNSNYGQYEKLGLEGSNEMKSVKILLQ